MSRSISDSTVRRLSHYLRALEDLERAGEASVSSDQLAHRGGTTAAQVRKDLSHFGSFGKRGHGYPVAGLESTLRGILGLQRPWNVALVGAGRIGRALFEYPAFEDRGYLCKAVLDSDPKKIGQRWGKLVIESADRLADVLPAVNTELAILAIPVGAAQGVADRVVQAGVRGILNFAPTRLNVPAGVTVLNIDVAAELEQLSFLTNIRSQSPGT